jgi:hypothetical protein
MIYFFSLTSIFSCMLLLTSAHALTISKLILPKAVVHNTTNQDETITVLFHEKCNGCARLHDMHTSTITIPAGEKKEIQEAPHIVRDITPTNR